MNDCVPITDNISDVNRLFVDGVTKADQGYDFWVRPYCMHEWHFKNILALPEPISPLGCRQNSSSDSSQWKITWVSCIRTVDFKISPLIKYWQQADWDNDIQLIELFLLRVEKFTFAKNMFDIYWHYIRTMVHISRYNICYSRVGFLSSLSWADINSNWNRFFAIHSFLLQPTGQL